MILCFTPLHFSPLCLGGRELWNIIAPLKPTILTGIPMNGESWAAKQKVQWCARQLGPEIPVICCMSRDKYLYVTNDSPAGADLSGFSSRWAENPCFSSLLSSKAVLIDDRPKNGRSWKGAGGLFVLHREGDVQGSLTALQGLNLKYSLGWNSEDLEATRSGVGGWDKGKGDTGKGDAPLKSNGAADDSGQNQLHGGKTKHSARGKKGKAKMR